jgi:hypothetical protein
LFFESAPVLVVGAESAPEVPLALAVVLLVVPLAVAGTDSGATKTRAIPGPVTHISTFQLLGVWGFAPGTSTEQPFEQSRVTTPGRPLASGTGLPSKTPLYVVPAQLMSNSSLVLAAVRYWTVTWLGLAFGSLSEVELSNTSFGMVNVMFAWPSAKLKSVRRLMALVA